MRFKSVARGNVPEQADYRARRFSFASQVVIPRPRSAVWDEYAQLDHPAWSECPGNENGQRRVGDVAGLAVGAAHMSELAPADSNGIRCFMYTEVRQVTAGQSVTLQCVVSNSFELTDTIRFLDHPSSGTLVEITTWCNTAPIIEARAERLQHYLQRVQLGYLNRALTWSPGIGYQANVVKPEPEDLQYISRPS